MDMIERARGLLAAQLRAKGRFALANDVVSGYEDDSAAILGIIAALTPPEGYTEVVRDAARYRYIRDIAAGDPVEFGLIDDAAYVAHYGDPDQFDFNIDEQMAARIEPL